MFVVVVVGGVVVLVVVTTLAQGGEERRGQGILPEVCRYHPCHGQGRHRGIIFPHLLLLLLLAYSYPGQAARERNIDCIVAPYEADAQLAFLNMCGLAQLVGTSSRSCLSHCSSTPTSCLLLLLLIFTPAPGADRRQRPDTIRL